MAAQIIQICPPAVVVTAALTPRQIGGSVCVAAARADYAARRGPSRNSVAAGCGLHRYIPD
jgi:hypothetical protein